MKALLLSHHSGWAELCRECAVGRTKEWIAAKAFLAQAEQQEALSDAELMEVAMFEGSGNKAARRAHELGVAELPGHLAPRQKEAQGAQAGDERAAFESWFTEKAKTLPLLRGEGVLRYHKGEGQYVSDWALFGHMVWQARAALATQPAAGEPVATVSRFFVSAWNDGSGQGGGWRYELKVLGGLPVGKSNLYAAPPAAAHGDDTASVIEEIRALLEEAYGFAAVSPRGQENINAALDLLDKLAAHGDEAVRFESPEALAKAISDHCGYAEVNSALVAGRIFAAMRAQGDGEVQ